jgi:hypothetical protein
MRARIEQFARRKSEPFPSGADILAQCHKELTAVKSRIVFVINWLHAFSGTLTTAGLVGMSGHFYHLHLSPTLSPIQSNGGEGAMAFWTVVGFRLRVGNSVGWRSIWLNLGEQIRVALGVLAGRLKHRPGACLIFPKPPENLSGQYPPTSAHIRPFPPIKKSAAFGCFG